MLSPAFLGFHNNIPQDFAPSNMPATQTKVKQGGNNTGTLGKKE